MTKLQIKNLVYTLVICTVTIYTALHPNKYSIAIPIFFGIFSIMGFFVVFWDTKKS